MNSRASLWYVAALLLPFLPRPVIGQDAIRPRAEWSAVLDSLARAWRDSAGLPGIALAVVAPDGVVLQAVAGVEDLRTARPVTAGSVFRTGSVTKQVTAMLVLRAVADRRVRLDAPIGSYVRDLPPAWREATVEQLLNHTSGIPSFTDLGEAWTSRWRDSLAPRALLALTADQPMWFVPGTQWRYDNVGYVLLGLLLEAVERRPLADVVVDDVSDALNLPTLQPCARVDATAQGYERPGAGDALTLAPYLHLAHAYAAGDLCANAGDLARWTSLLFDSDLLPESLRERMRTPHGAAAAYRYGFGVRLDSLGRHAIVLHGGDIPGFTAATLHAPGTGLAVAVLTNISGAPAEAYVSTAARILLGVPAAPSDVAVPLDVRDRDLAVGRYTVALPGDSVSIALIAVDSGLSLRIREAPPVPLVYFGSHPDGARRSLRFGAGFDPGFRLILELDAGGVVRGRVLQRGGSFALRPAR